MNKPKSIFQLLAGLEGNLEKELPRLARLRQRGELPLLDGESYRNGKGRKVTIRFKIDFFRSQIMSFSETTCWGWKGYFDTQGYGRLKIKQKAILAHRFSFAVFNGFDSDKFICHHCDNPRCVNPDHLFEGTQKDNMQDCASKGRKPGSKGEDNGAHKLTEPEVLEILASGLSLQCLADKYGMSKSMMHNIKARHYWKHLHV